MVVAARQCSCVDVVIRVRKPTGIGVAPRAEQQVHVVGCGSGFCSLHEGSRQVHWKPACVKTTASSLSPAQPIAHGPEHVGPQKAPQVKEVLTTLNFNVSIQTVA